MGCAGSFQWSPGYVVLCNVERLSVPGEETRVERWWQEVVEARGFLTEPLCFLNEQCAALCGMLGMKSYIAIIVTSLLTCDSKCKHQSIARVIMTMGFQSALDSAVLCCIFRCTF